MSAIKKRICKEKDCGGEVELLVKIKENRDRLVPLFHCARCGRMYSSKAFEKEG